MNTVREVNVREAHHHLGRYRVIDVREPHELAQGRIAHAENVPLARLAHVADGWSREQPILVVCRSGGRSSRGAAELARLGFRNVTNLNGGMMAWQSQGLPTLGAA